MSPPPPTPGAALIGTWRNGTLVFGPGTIQTTTWQFAPGGHCLQIFLTIADGAQLQTNRPCTYVAGLTSITVTYAGATASVTFTLSYSFPASNRLRLDTDEFDRVG